MLKKILPYLALPLLAACGGGADLPESFNDLVDETDQILIRFEDAEFEITPVDSLPATGEAAFDGTMFLDDGIRGFLGDARVSADFDAQTIGGSVKRVFRSDGLAYSGVLRLTNGTIDTNADPELEPQVIADLDGTLTDDDGTDELVDVLVLGDFYGPGAEGFYADLGGEMHTNPASSSTDPRDVTGFILADR